MKKMYIYPQTDLMDRVETTDLMDVKLGSGSGPEPTAPERQAEGGEFLPL